MARPTVLIKYRLINLVASEKSLSAKTTQCSINLAKVMQQYYQKDTYSHKRLQKIKHKSQNYNYSSITLISLSTCGNHLVQIYCRKNGNVHLTARGIKILPSNFKGINCFLHKFVTCKRLDTYQENIKPGPSGSRYPHL